MTTTDFVIKELCNVIDFNKNYATLDDVQMTVSMPQIVELVNRAIKQEREACALICAQYDDDPIVFVSVDIAKEIRARR